VTRQAQMIAYNDDFKLMFFMTLALMPVVLLLRPARIRPREPVVME
jgi:MFS transporter, DHA2 family, multidrug resistance protein